MDTELYSALDARFRNLMDLIAGGDDVSAEALDEATLLEAARAVADEAGAAQSDFAAKALARAAHDLWAAAIAVHSGEAVDSDQVVEAALAEVRHRASGRTNYPGKLAPADEVLANEVMRLRAEIAVLRSLKIGKALYSL